MWKYTKCTAGDRADTLNELADAFGNETDCLRYLSRVQGYINSTQNTVVLVQDLDANVLIEMDYVPINDFVFHVVSIEDNGIKKQELQCQAMPYGGFKWLGES